MAIIFLHMERLLRGFMADLSYPNSAKRSKFSEPKCAA
jgi:hypothetical protein